LERYLGVGTGAGCETALPPPLFGSAPLTALPVVHHNSSPAINIRDWQ
jgi:hypothetical protein